MSHLEQGILALGEGHDGARRLRGVGSEEEESLEIQRLQTTVAAAANGELLAREQHERHGDDAGRRLLRCAARRFAAAALRRLRAHIDALLLRHLRQKRARLRLAALPRTELHPCLLWDRNRRRGGRRLALRLEEVGLAAAAAHASAHPAAHPTAHPTAHTTLAAKAAAAAWRAAALAPEAAAEARSVRAGAAARRVTLLLPNRLRLALHLVSRLVHLRRHDHIMQLLVVRVHLQVCANVVHLDRLLVTTLRQRDGNGRGSGVIRRDGWGVSSGGSGAAAAATGRAAQVGAAALPGATAPDTTHSH